MLLGLPRWLFLFNIIQIILSQEYFWCILLDSCFHLHQCLRLLHSLWHLILKYDCWQLYNNSRKLRVTFEKNLKVNFWDLQSFETWCCVAGLRTWCSHLWQMMSPTAEDDSTIFTHNIRNHYVCNTALNFKSLFYQVYFHCLFHKHKITTPSKCCLKLIITQQYPIPS